MFQTAVLVAASLGAGVPDKAAKSLYERLGGKKAIVAVVDEFVANCAGDNRINSFFGRTLPQTRRDWLFFQTEAG